MIFPNQCFIGVSQDKRTIKWAARFGIPIQWTHCYLLFTWPSNDLLLFEASWRGVSWAHWDKAHQADGWAWYADDRATPETAARLYAFCEGACGKLYSYPLLVRLALRLIWQAWRNLRGVVRGRGGIAEVCSSLVNEAGQAIFGEPYSLLPNPSPDEVVSNPHLHFAQAGGV